jgi:hypothetical protein
MICGPLSPFFCQKSPPNVPFLVSAAVRASPFGTLDIPSLRTSTMLSRLILALAIIAVAVAFSPRLNRAASKTVLFENFKITGPPKIESDPRIFTEKQLREFTAEYSTDERWNPFAFLFGGGGDNSKPAPAIKAKVSTIERYGTKKPLVFVGLMS